jgi:NarL family two-component system sensor histidine kinase LiaS
LNVPASAEEDLYRIVLEALTNVVKHARAGKTIVHVDDSRASLSIRVVDDGIGFDTDIVRPGHLGLRSMAERATRIGAELSVRSGLDGGTEVELRFPKVAEHEVVAS